MRESRLLHNHLKMSCPEVHLKRLSTLSEVSESLLNQGSLSLTGLGRKIRGKAKVKHKIKMVDRLLGNQKMQAQVKDIYRGCAQIVLSGKKEIRVNVDWSPCGNRQQQILCASLSSKRNPMILLAQVHPETTKEGRHAIHKKFLEELKWILPFHLEVTIVTDAGFKGKWFNLVRRQGWHFEGRVRSNILYSMDCEKWIKTSDLYKQASSKPKYIGNVKLTKRHQIDCHLYLVGEGKKQKKVYNGKPKLSSNSSKAFHKKMGEKQRRLAKDPWVIVSSKSHGKKRTRDVIKTYEKRMQIEHAFRRLKNTRWGVGLDRARSHDVKRLEVLLLIGALGVFMLWLIGLAAEKKKMHYAFQANTEKTRRVLSLSFLGLQVIDHAYHKINLHDIKCVLRELQACTEL